VNLGEGDAQQNRFEIFKDGQTLHFAFAANSGGQVDLSAAVESWQPGEQHLVSATWGGGQVTFYVDGKLAGQQPYSGQLEVGNNVPLTIGSDYVDAATLPGRFSQFHMYKRPLTQEEVAAQAAAIAAGASK
jgi:hypothetical protein